MPDEPIRYGVVGLGRAGWDIHVKQLRDRADAKIVAVVDPVEQRRQQAAADFGCKTYDSLKKLLKQDDIDVVVVATPSVRHGPDTKLAFKAGKHVVVEKPMAMSPAEAQSMIDASAAAGKRLFVHQNYRFFPEFTFLEQTVRSGILGKIFHIRCYLSHFARRNDWQTLVKNGGGTLNNTGPHFLDQGLQLLGAPVVQVMGDLQQIVSSGDVEDHMKAFIRAENGATFDIEISGAENIAPPLPKWILCGSTGTLSLSGNKATINYFDPSQVAPLPVVEGPAADRRYGNDDKLPWQTRTVEAVGPDVGNFYDNVAGVLRRGEPMRVTPESVIEVMRVISMIRKGTKFSGKIPKETKNVIAEAITPA